MFVLVADVHSLLLCSIYLVALLLVFLASVRAGVRSLVSCFISFIEFVAAFCFISGVRSLLASFISSRLLSRVCNRSLFHSSPCCRCALTRSRLSLLAVLCFVLAKKVLRFFSQLADRQTQQQLRWAASVRSVRGRNASARGAPAAVMVVVVHHRNMRRKRCRSGRRKRRKSK